MNRPVLVCMWCALYSWRLVELSTVTLRTRNGEWRHWYCHACGRSGHTDMAGSHGTQRPVST